MQTTILVLFAILACALAGRGGGGGFKFPQSCKDAHEATKKCVETNAQAKGVNIKVEDVKKCFATCPRGKGEGKGEGRGKGWGKGDHPKSKDGSSPNGGNWAQFKETFKALHECMSGKLGDKMETCVSGKITYAVAAPKESKGDEHGPGGRGGRWGKGKHGKGGRGGHGGNPLKTLKDKVAKCGAETETCVKAAMGEWYDKIDELSQIMCDVSKACPKNADQCKTDLKAGKAAHCACKEQLKPDFEQAKTDCTTDANREAIERMSQRAGKGKGGHKDRCDDDDDDDDDDSNSDEKERKNPFCDA